MTTAEQAIMSTGWTARATERAWLSRATSRSPPMSAPHPFDALGLVVPAGVQSQVGHAAARDVLDGNEKAPPQLGRIHADGVDLIRGVAGRQVSLRGVPAGRNAHGKHGSEMLSKLALDA